MARSVIVAVVSGAMLVLAGACTGYEGSSGTEPATESSPDTVVVTEPVPAVEGLPDPVAGTRARILAAATAQDYDGLEPLVDSESFLSDAGFGADPVAYWRDRGTRPLEAMATLLALPHTVRETNEGALYQWPRLTADSDPEDMSAAEREALTALLGQRGLERAFNSETGYVAPRLGILSDGTWFTFIQDPAP